MRAILLDLDGTLADTLGDIAGAMNHCLEARGLPAHAVEAYRLFIGEGVEMLARHALPADRHEICDEIVAAFRARYAETLLETTRPYPGVVQMLEALAARGVAMAVLSNKPDPATQKIVRALFPDVSFGAVLGHRPEHPRKPDPTSALAIAHAIGLEPGAIAFLGDSAVDIHTAQNAGMFPIGALWGFRSREELDRAGARALVSHPHEVLAVLDQIVAQNMPS